MIEAVLVILTQARPGRKADLDDWYTNIHVRDALRFRGSISPPEARTSRPHREHAYVGIYKVNDGERPGGHGGKATC
jgi:hypothetical protein